MLLVVPNSEAHGMKKRREDWVWCQQPFVHVIHFNSSSLSQAAAHAGLSVVSTWSRDTWDANRIYDEGVDEKIRAFIGRFFDRHPRISFGLEESFRLLFYGVGCAHHWLFHRECQKMDGSELLLLGERQVK